ncbi:hypothetical protein LSUE1_G000855 [Lachnellula suecica]|uniref:Uncharacterized protein n=1 Tax=Lachnellula suecica TaxID=602035 RepID=A0A8T9CBQ1_9HELO|nr:hypothetical protein LSUE1_G000855 [Lachnellula suecica]
MPFLRPTAFSSLSRRAAHLSIRQPLAVRSLSSTPSRFSQGYGDGEGDPKGEAPQEQGTSQATRNVEHPGPKSPAEGQGTKSPEDASAQSGGSRSKDAKESGSSPTGGSVGGGGGKSSSNGASPKIHDKSVPGGDNSADKQAEVEQHNKEFEQRHDRAPKAENDKVDKKFWSNTKEDNGA